MAKTTQPDWLEDEWQKYSGTWINQVDPELADAIRQIFDSGAIALLRAIARIHDEVPAARLNAEYTRLQQYVEARRVTILEAIRADTATAYGWAALGRWSPTIKDVEAN